MALLAGKTGFVLQNGVARRFGKWKLPVDVDVVMRNNFVDAPFKRKIPGLIGTTLTVSGPYDAGLMPLTAGATYTWTLGWTSTLSIAVTGFIKTLGADNDVETGPNIDLTIEIDGSFQVFVT